MTLRYLSLPTPVLNPYVGGESGDIQCSLIYSRTLIISLLLSSAISTGAKCLATLTTSWIVKLLPSKITLFILDPPCCFSQHRYFFLLQIYTKDHYILTIFSSHRKIVKLL